MCKKLASVKMRNLLLKAPLGGCRRVKAQGTNHGHLRWAARHTLWKTTNYLLTFTGAYTTPQTQNRMFKRLPSLGRTCNSSLQKSN